MKVMNPAPHIPDQAMVSILTAYMQTRTEAEFDDIRNNVAGYAGLADGEIHQHAQDAGYEVDTT